MPSFFYIIRYIKFMIFVLISLCFIQKSASLHLANVSTSLSGTIQIEFCEKPDCLPKFTFEERDFHNASFVSQFFENLINIDISTQCKESLSIYFNEVINLKPWALEMLDASGKIPSSFFSITMIDYGSLEDCIKIQANSDYGENLFKGKFCMLHLKHPLFQTPHHNQLFNEKSYVEVFGEPPDWIKYDIENYIPLRFGYYGGICVPSTCTDKELDNVISTLVEPLSLDATLSDCQIEEPLNVPDSAKLIMLFFVVLLLACATGTILDLSDRKQENNLKRLDKSLSRQLLKCFSLYTNVRELFTINSKDSFKYINGFRAFMCIVIIWGHAMMFPTQWKELRYRNFHFVFEFLEIAIENNGPFTVDFFFAMTGFLLGYFTWKKLEQNNGRLNIFENIVQKYWRLTVPQIFVILLLYIMQPTLNLGPIWNTTLQHEHKNCYQNGWKNLLYIQNFDELTDICLTHTWYIANTMQHLIISLPLMIVTFRYPKTGITFGLLLYFVSNIYHYYGSIDFQLPFVAFTSLKYTHLAEVFASKLYVYSTYHIPAHFFGMLCGWACYKYGKKKLPMMWLIFGWSICALTFCFVIFAIYIPTNDLRIAAFYNVSRVSATGLGTCWIFYACGSGQGGVVDKILSSKALVPLSRISYSVFMVHPLYLIFRDAINAERYYMDRIMHIAEFVPFLLWSIIAGFLVYILIEEPFNKMYAPLKKRIMSSTPPREATQNGKHTVLNKN